MVSEHCSPDDYPPTKTTSSSPIQIFHASQIICIIWCRKPLPTSLLSADGFWQWKIDFKFVPNGRQEWTSADCASAAYDRLHCLEWLQASFRKLGHRSLPFLPKRLKLVINSNIKSNINSNIIYLVVPGWYCSVCALTRQCWDPGPDNYFLIFSTFSYLLFTCSFGLVSDGTTNSLFSRSNSVWWTHYVDEHTG